MKTTIKTIIAILSLSTVAYAASEAREAKPVACKNYNVFKDANGVEIGLCGASKPGGKSSVLRSFTVATVIDPTNDKPVKVLVGFR